MSHVRHDHINFAQLQQKFFQSIVNWILDDTSKLEMLSLYIMGMFMLLSGYLVEKIQL